MHREHPPLSPAGRTLYEVNVRQFTAEGTLAAFAEHLPRLADLGVGCLWFMPIHPIGAARRKGPLGSYYAVRDYVAVNPEFGTAADFRAVVDRAHDLGLTVILDWVANHTAWDHPWVAEFPERYQRDAAGELVLPEPDWDDVANLDFECDGTARAMADAMLFWVREFAVDGFRCDVAERVPARFWREAIGRLRAEREVYLLAEGERDWLYAAGFDATYGWDLARAVEGAVREESALRLREFLLREQRTLANAGPGAHRMLFTTNHDWNSWETTAVDRYGEGLDLATVLTFTLPGIPMVYSGQEAGLDRPLAFFERDPIQWRSHPAADRYRALARLKAAHPALAHGARGGGFELLEAGDAPELLLFERSATGATSLRVAANFGARAVRLDRGVLEPANWGTVDGGDCPASLPARAAVVLESRD